MTCINFGGEKQQTKQQTNSTQNNTQITNRTDNEQQQINNIINKKDNKEVCSCIEHYNQNIGPISQTTAERLFDYINDFNKEEADKVICEAIDRAVENNVRKPKYIYSILDDWVKKHYKTLADVKNEKKKKKNQNFEYNNYEKQQHDWDDLYDN